MSVDKGAINIVEASHEKKVTKMPQSLTKHQLRVICGLNIVSRKGLRAALIAAIAITFSYSTRADDLTFLDDWSDKDIGFLKSYSAAVIYGASDATEDTIAYWQQKNVNVEIQYVGRGSIDENFPRLNIALDWIDSEFADVSSLSLKISTKSSERANDVDISIPAINVYAINGDSPRQISDINIRGIEEATSTSARKFGHCEMTRWRSGSHIIKAVGLIHLETNAVSNIKCLSRILLFGLGQDFAVDPPSWAKPIGVMTEDPNAGLELPNILDITLLRLMYGSGMRSGETKREAIEYIEKIRQRP